MSTDRLRNVMTRIIAAEPNSPIAVFECLEGGKVDAVFASTVVTRMLVNGKHPGLIGVFHGNMNTKGIALLLSAYTN